MEQAVDARGLIMDNVPNKQMLVESPPIDPRNGREEPYVRLGEVSGSGERTPEGSAGPGFSPRPGCLFPALFENLEGGATIEEFMEWFQPVDEWKVKAVLEHVVQDLDSKVAYLRST